jgi:hypothetical protein
MVEETINEALELVSRLDKGKLITPKLCDGCASSSFREKCFFYWDNKSFCSQHTGKAIY